jgi:hypothetical protein
VRQRRRFLICLVLLVGLAVVSLTMVMWLTAPKGNINANSFKAINGEMTEEQVEALLGVPPGDYRTVEHVGRGQITLASCVPTYDDEQKPKTSREWQGNEGSITVTFDQYGRAMSKAYMVPGQRPPDWLARLRRWLGL